MIIGASLGGFRGLTLEQAIKLYSKLSEDFNLNAVEIRFEREGRRPALWHWEADETIKDFLSNFEVAGAHLPFVYLNPISQNPCIREMSISQLKSAIEKASDLGMDYCVMHARGFNYALSHEEVVDEWRKVIEELVRFAEENSILLTLENADFLHDLSILVKIVREINSKQLRITLDIGHAYIRKVAPLSTYPVKDLVLRALDAFLPLFFTKKNMPYEVYGSLENFIESELDLISVVHVHDYNGRRDHLPMGKGKIDFSFLSKLKDFKAVFILEIEFENHYEDFKRSYLTFRRLMKI
jgi:sugar phosphate isomerase/epimerase